MSGVRATTTAAAATLLTAFALDAVFAEHNWWQPVTLAVLVVAFVAETARRLRVPALLATALAAAGALAFVTTWFAPAHARLRVVPTGRTLHELGLLWSGAFDDIAHLAAPVPTTRGIVLVTTAGVVLVALAVDLLAAGLRRPATAGLPLLALFAVPVAIAPHGVGVAAFVAGAAGWLLLLSADSRDRLERWGRALVRTRRGGQVRTVGTAGPAGAGRRIGLVAVVVAVVLPLLAPGMTHRTFGHGHGPFGSGSTAVTTYNPIVRLRDQLNDPQDRPLLRVRTDDSTPGYLRMTALDVYDGEVWSSSQISGGTDTRVSHGLPAPDYLVPSTVVHDRIEVLPNLDVHWLPVPFVPTAVGIRGDWRFDPVSGTVFSARNDTRGVSYDVSSLVAGPSADDLRAAAEPDETMNPYLTLPADLPPLVRRLTDQVVAGAATDYDRAVAIQTYLRGPEFVYDTHVPRGDSGSALVDFLQSKRGFCEQYAATMAVMARIAGIPSRVAIGFTHGTQQPDGSYLITTHDAHAWPELYFPGAGWVRFEPTPRSDGQADPPAYTLPVVPGGNTSGGTDQPNATPSTAPSGQPDGANRPDGGSAANPSTHVSGGWWGRRAGLLGGLAALVLLVVSPALLRRGVRRARWQRARDGTTVAHAAWAELRDDVVDLGLGWQPGASPRAAARSLADRARLDPTARAALGRLLRLEEVARYAATPPAAARKEAAADVAEVRAGLRRAVSRRRRLRAGVLPGSTGRWVRAAVGRGADAWDAADRAGARVRVWLEGHRPGRRTA